MEFILNFDNSNKTYDDTGLPDCKGCGKCCKNLHVILNKYDKIPKEMTYNLLNLTLMKRVGLDCIALDLKTNLCTIYENRPNVCKMFNRGNPQCRDLFKDKKINEV